MTRLLAIALGIGLACALGLTGSSYAADTLHASPISINVEKKGATSSSLTIKAPSVEINATIGVSDRQAKAAVDIQFGKK